MNNDIASISRIGLALYCIAFMVFQRMDCGVYQIDEDFPMLFNMIGMTLIYHALSYNRYVSSIIVYMRLTAHETAATTTSHATAPNGPYCIGSILPAAAPRDGEGLAVVVFALADAGALPSLAVKDESLASLVLESVTPLELEHPPDPPAAPVPLIKLTAAHCILFSMIRVMKRDYSRTW